MSEIIYKTFRVEVKNVDAENGTLDVLIPMSTGSMDRDDEVIQPNAWKKSLPAFKKRPILLSSHDYRDLRKQIGEFTQLKLTDEGLFGKPKYYINEGNEEADWAFNLASKNRAAFSVGFIPKACEDGEDEKSPKRTYTEAELLEISQVVVPSNREAIQSMMAKGIKDPIISQLCDDVLECKELITKPEETDDFIRIPNPKDDKNHDGHRIRTITIDEGKGITALYCGECKVIKTYIFAKAKGWTMAKAKKWVEDHSKSYEEILEDIDEVEKEIPTRNLISQDEIIDEFDYLIESIQEAGLSEDTKEPAWDLVREIMRFHGDDIPLDIEEKVGAVLNQKNKDRLNQIKALAQQVLDSAGEKPEPEKEDDDKKTITEERVIEIVMKAVTEAIAKAQGKV